MSKINKEENYLEKKPDDEKKKVKEQMIYGNGKTLKERETAKKEYKNNKLNE